MIQMVEAVEDKALDFNAMLEVGDTFGIGTLPQEEEVRVDKRPQPP